MSTSLQAQASAAASPTTTKKRGRSTTGCGNCKKRKLKCDERRPGCSRCEIGGLTCQGYPARGFRWSSKHEHHETHRRHASVAHETDSRSPLSRTEQYDDHSGQRGLPDVQSNSGSSNDLAGSPPFASNILVTNSELQSESDSLAAITNFPEVRSAFGGSASPGLYAVSSSTAWNQGSDPALHAYGTAVSTVLPGSFPSSSVIAHPSASPYSSLLHIPTLLVEYYFQKVCRECSTFDSSFNPFRTMISKMRDTSAPINYAIQSLAASKLADDMPRMKLVGIEAQCQALEEVKNECLNASALHNVSDEVLCTILLLGMTTSWHVRRDLGTEYLALAGKVISARAEASDLSAKSNLDFFQKALKYWAMIVSLVSNSAEGLDVSVRGSNMISAPAVPTIQYQTIMPHPWTGISPGSFDLFGQVLRLIRKARVDSGKSTRPTFSRASIDDLYSAIASAERLEKECWSLSIPSIEHVEDTGDLDTPPLHHVLTAQGYLLAALLHIYMIFPDVLESRRRCMSATEPTVSAPQTRSDKLESAEGLSKARLWPRRSNEDHHNAWLRDIGVQIVECLESIGVESSTRVVHPPLLLSVATALTLSDEQDGVTDARIRQCRHFITTRLEIMQALMRFHAIDNILKVIKEVWRRADAGAQDVFWMDVMSELKCESLFG